MYEKLRALIEVWDEQNDPTLYYYPSIPSHTNFNLLNLQVSRKRILGLFLIMNMVNVVNLLFPDINKLSHENKNEG